MESGHCIKILDPYKWMPGHGENSVEIFTKRENSLTVVIAYDSDDGGEQRKEITFTGVSAFYKSSFPGSDMLRITYNTKDKENISFGNLVEYPESEAAQAWTEYWYRSCRITRKIKHYKWLFLSANLRLEVFAEEVQWEEDHPSCR